MAKSEDLVKFIAKQVTTQVVTYMDTPREVRKERRQIRKEQPREHWLNRWFGLLPMAMGHWTKPVRRLLHKNSPAQESTAAARSDQHTTL